MLFILLSYFCSYEYVAKNMKYDGSFLVSYSSPLLQMIDTSPVQSLGEFISLQRNLQNQLRHQGGAGLNFRYGFFSSTKSGLDLLCGIVRDNKIVPKVSKVYNFDEVPEAYHDMVNNRHFGKVVVQL